MLFACQDQLNFHKLLGCDCQSPLRKYYCAGRSVVSSEADQMKEVAKCNSPEGLSPFMLVCCFPINMCRKSS